MTVSYTHLDVYKRQGLKHGNQGCEAELQGIHRVEHRLLILLHILVAVSYTHLDVYKRQVVRNLLRIIGKKVRSSLFLHGDKGQAGRLNRQLASPLYHSSPKTFSKI